MRCGSKRRGGFGWKGTDKDGLLSFFLPVKESELRELRKTLERAQAEQEALQKQLQTKKERLQDAYLSGVIELQEFASAKSALEESLAQAQQELDKIRAQSDDNCLRAQLQESIAAAVHTLRSPDAGVEEKHNAARSVIDTCIWDKSQSLLTISYRIIF